MSPIFSSLRTRRKLNHKFTERDVLYSKAEYWWRPKFWSWVTCGLGKRRKITRTRGPTAMEVGSRGRGSPVPVPKIFKRLSALKSLNPPSATGFLAFEGFDPHLLRVYLPFTLTFRIIVFKN